jgi:hypothetical protein
MQSTALAYHIIPSDALTKTQGTRSDRVPQAHPGAAGTKAAQMDTGHRTQDAHKSLNTNSFADHQEGRHLISQSPARLRVCVACCVNKGQAHLFIQVSNLTYSQELVAFPSKPDSG